MSRAILDQCRTAWLVADRSKLTRQAPVRIAGLDRIDRVFMNGPVPPDLSQAAAASGTVLTPVSGKNDVDPAAIV